MCSHIIWFLLFTAAPKPALGFASCGSDAASLLQRTGSLSPAASRQIQTQAHAVQINSSSVSAAFPEVFVIIPGLGEESRVPWVRDNIKILKEELGNNFACSLVVYGGGAETNPSFDRDLFAPCKVEYKTESSMFSAMKAANLSSVEATSNILVLLDDIVLSRSALRTMRSLQFHGGHDVVSGSYHGSWCPLMDPRHGYTAHASTYVELNAVLFKRKSFICYQSIIDPVINPMGYGYMNMYNSLCSVSMVVCDACVVQHMSEHGPPKGAPPTYDHSKANHMMQKWRAMLGQKAQGWDCCWEARGLKGPPPPEDCQFR